MTKDKSTDSNVTIFPKPYKPNPSDIEAGAERRKTTGEKQHPNRYHDEIFEYSDGSYVILVQPKKEKFTIERMVFMARRLEMTLFDALPCYEDWELEIEPDPPKAS